MITNKNYLSKIDLGKFVKSNPYKNDIIYDPRGQWDHPGENTRIPGSDITMENVNYPVWAQPSVGPGVMMQPGQDYNFPGADYVDEFPHMKKGGKTQSKKYSRSLSATNRLFTTNFLFKKHKHKIFDPNASYYEDGGYVEVDNLTPEQIQQYAQGGYIIEEGNNYKQGGDPKPKKPRKEKKAFVTSDLQKYKKRKQDYNDSLTLYKASLKEYDVIKNTNNHKNMPLYEKEAYNAYKRLGYPKGYNINIKRPDNVTTKSVLYEKPVQQIVYQPKQKKSQSNKNKGNNTFINDYNKKYPPIYLSDKNDPRIGSYAEKGNQYLYKKPIKPVTVSSNLKKIVELSKQIDPKKEEETTKEQKQSETVKENIQTVVSPTDPVITSPIEEVVNTEKVMPPPVMESTGTYDYSTDTPDTELYWDKNWHSFRTPRLNHHFPLGPLFNGKKKHNFSTPVLRRREVEEFSNGGHIYADLTPEEIQEYAKGGYVIEDISVPSLSHMQEGGEPCPEGQMWDEATQSCVSANETTTEEVGFDPIDMWAQDYEEKNPRGNYVYDKKQQYLKRHKGLNKAAGVTLDNFPKEVEDQINEKYNYNMNGYITDRMAKVKKFNPKKRDEWVDELGPRSKEVVADSKYGSKLQPSLWSRSLAGLATLASPFSPDLQAEVKASSLPGLTRKETNEIYNANFKGIPLGGLETFSAADIPGAAIANYLKNSKKDNPNIFSGELMSNVDATDAMAMNPIGVVGGIEGLAALGTKGISLLGLTADALKPGAKGLSKLELPGSPNAYDNVQKAGFLNPLAIADRIIPRLPYPSWFLGQQGSWNNISPLNIIPGYGKKLSNTAGQYPVGFRKFGNTLDDVKSSKTLRPKGGFRKGADQMAREGNWAEPGKVNENYVGVFEATMDPNIEGSNIKLTKKPNRYGIVGTTKEGDVAIPLTDAGLSFNRRLPFSNKYVPINKQKLLDNKFQLATQLPHVQSLIEKYGIAAGQALVFGYLTNGKEGAIENLKTVNKYTVDPVINWSKKEWDNLKKITTDKKEGGEIIVNDLSDHELQEYLKGGYIIERLN